MKKLLAIILVVVVLALDWAALDDITTGLESDYLGEYAVLGVSLLFLLLLGWVVLRNR